MVARDRPADELQVFEVVDDLSSIVGALARRRLDTPYAEWPAIEPPKRRPKAGSARQIERCCTCKKKAHHLTMAGFSTAIGAGEMNRTPDLLITNELLYRLSYTGEACDYSGS